MDQRSPARHPDFLGPDDMIVKIEELREATDWEVPIFVKMGASRVFDDVKLAAKAGADVIVVDGMEGGTGASPAIFQEHTGIPTLAAVCEARAALEDCGQYGEIQLIIAGGIRDGADAAKAIALGADAVYIGTAALIALNCNKALHVDDYHRLGTEPGYCHHCHTGRCPVGVTTQDPQLMERLEIEQAAERVANLLRVMTAGDSNAGSGLWEVGRSPPGAGGHGGAYARKPRRFAEFLWPGPEGLRGFKRDAEKQAVGSKQTAEDGGQWASFASRGER